MKKTKVKIDVNKNNLKQLIVGVIILDCFSIFNLILQIYLNDISYFSYILLFICNLVVFITYKLNRKKT